MDRADFRFTRRDVRELTQWGHTQLKVHLKRLQEMEFVVVHRSGQRYLYELLWSGAGADGQPILEGLVDPDQLNKPNGHPVAATAKGPRLRVAAGAL